MSTPTYAVHDTATMLRRNFKRMLRYPALTFTLVGTPVVFLLLFVYVFGGTLGAGLGGGEPGAAGRAAYVDYVAPGIVLMTVFGAAAVTAVAVSMDMTQGIVARFRTMAIFRPAILTAHVVGSVLQTLLCMAVVMVVAVLIGFRPNATPVEWPATAGLLALVVVAFTWLAVCLGLVASNVESASNLPMPLMLLPFLGNGFVPAESMPAGLAWFAEYQPVTPIVRTLRGLLLGSPIGDSAWSAIAWCSGITVVCFCWALWLFNREPVR